MAFLISESFEGAFGTLNDGTAPEGLRKDHLPLKRNVEHAKTGAVSKRPGRKIVAEVAPAAENSVAPPMTNLGATSGSTLTNGTLYVRLTYSTVAGETDDLHSTGNSIAVSAGDGVKVWIPLGIMAREVMYHDVQTPSLILKDGFNTTTLTSFANDTFNGWYVYCRDPQVQDETHLGTNPENRKLWDRLNYLAKVSDYDAATKTFTLDTGIQSDLVGKFIDIVPPDRGGLPIRAANLYVSQNSSGPYYLYESVEGSAPTSVTVTSIPTSNRQSPETRITRTAPALGELAVTDTSPATGAPVSVSTGLEGGEYIVRYAWETASSTSLDSGGWPEASSFGFQTRPRRTTQLAWPSKAGRITIRDGYAIRCILPTYPSGVERAHVYVKKVTPTATKTFASITNPSATHRGYYYNPSGDGSAADVASSFTPAAFRALGTVSQFATAAGSDPSYAAVAAADGTITSSYTDQAINKVQLEFKLDAGELAAASAVCLVVRMSGKTGNAYSAANANYTSVRLWNGSGSFWQALQSNIDPTSSTYVTHRYAHDFVGSLVEVDGGVSRMVYDIVGQQGAGWNLDYAALEIYQTSLTTDPSVTSTEIKAEVTRETDFNITSPLVPSGDGDPIRANTTNQWPVSLHSAYISQRPGRVRDDVTVMVGCADSVFVVDGTALKRVYQHESLSGLTSNDTFEVCKCDWGFASLPGRVYFFNERSTLGHNLRFDGVQTHGMGCPAPNGRAVLPPPVDDKPPEDDPEPELDCTSLQIAEQWKPDYTDTASLQRTSPVQPIGVVLPRTGWARLTQGGNRTDAGPSPRWRVRKRDDYNTWWQVYDYRDIGLVGPAYRPFVRAAGLEGKVFIGRPAIPNLVIPRQIHLDDADLEKLIIECCTRGATAGPPGATNEVADGQGTAETEDTQAAGVPPGDREYYVVWVRKLEADQRSYVVRSVPELAVTVTLDEKIISSPNGTVTTSATDSGKIVRLHVARPNDPQVTHVEFYRTLVDQAEAAKMVGEVPLVAASLDLNGNISFDDSYTDEQLTLDMFWTTGQPPPATRMYWHNERMWIVPTWDVSSVAFTNIDSAAGGRDPEGFWFDHTFAPSYNRQAAITAIAPAGTRVMLHSDNGVAVVTGSSDDFFSPDPIRSQTLLTDEGAVGPNAWLNVGSAHLFWSRSGISAIVGTEVRYLADLVKGTIAGATLTDKAACSMSGAHFRAIGKNQAWFSYSDRPDGRCDNMLILEMGVGEAHEEQRRLWTKWTEMYANSTCRSERLDGSEVMYLGDHWGRLHEHGARRHDNGIHVDAEMRTQPLDLGQPGKSARPRFLFLNLSGGNKNYLNVDFLKDLEGSRSNDRLQRIDLQGTGGTTWGSGGRVGANYTPGVWGSTRSTGYREHRMQLGRSFRDLQLVFSQKWADQPPGTRRDQSFEMSGFTIAYKPLGFRRVRS